MARTLQGFLVDGTQKALDNLKSALERVPEDKRDWSAMGDARTALDMMAECALLNGSTVDMLETRKFPEFDAESYNRERAELIAEPEKLLALLEANTERVKARVAAMEDTDFEVSLDSPWGAMTLAQVASYPHWNMSYHEGQINFIASMLGCLK